MTIGAATIAIAAMWPVGVSAQDAAPASPVQPSEIREIGGRLVITGETVIVAGDPDRPPGEASIATKVDTPLRETPRSISVTERRTLDDRQAIKIADAHDYTVGIMTFDERGPAYARGFRVDFYDLRRDGLRTYAWSVREPVGLERIQYLRGPASILYGDGSPGALVNLVLRKPLPVRRTELTAAAGDQGYGRVTGDVTGPIGDTRGVRYRLIGAAEWFDNGYGNDERRLSLLPMLSIDVGRRATLHVDGELYQQRGRGYRHVVPVTPDTQRGDFSQLPWDLNVVSPWNGWSGWNASPGARLDVQVGPTISLHTAVRYTRIGGDIHGEIATSASGDLLTRVEYLERSTWQETQSDTFLTAQARTGRIAHGLVFGVEGGLSTADSAIGIGPAPPLDMANPVYLPSLGEPVTRPTRYDVGRLGVYVQDQMRLHPAVIVVPGFRLSRIAVDDRVASGTPGVEDASSEFKASPSLGVVVLPRPWLSLHASAAQGFEPPAPAQYTADGRALDVADTHSFEGGARVEALAGRLTTSVAAFRMRRTNVPEADGLGSFLQIGEGRSRGIELELAGSVVPGLAVQGGYAWTRTEVTRSELGHVGRELPHAPRHLASVWARYRVGQGRLAGLMLAGGVVHVSDRFVATDNVSRVPGYTRLDLSAAYDLAGWARLGVAIPNATDVRYATGGAGQQLFAGTPRRISLQLTTRF